MFMEMTIWKLYISNWPSVYFFFFFEIEEPVMVSEVVRSYCANLDLS